MIKNILWDFDGVILDSMPTREYGFRKIFENFDEKIVDQLIAYHNINGGLSRYVKIRYLYENLLNQEIEENEVLKIAKQFSIIMKKELTNKKYLIKETIDFISTNYKKYNFHIVSGSDNNELNFLCEELGLTHFFKSIHGSPTPKNELVKNVLYENSYNQNETILIGDSLNDYEAAKVNDLDFYGFNNKSLKEFSNVYIFDYKELIL